ncbi:LysR family transcriptional regulator [Escherichia coli]|uniref:LysR family transcriptional regulator n=1 Tax=Escherichia coli TaxID=562 RepID=UPI00339C81D9
MFISSETIRIIHLVARHQNITTAAEQLNKVPSTISYTLKKAEETLGVELFIRKGRYIELSPASTSSNIAKISAAILDALKRNTVLINERELTIAVNNIIPGDFLVSFIQDFE